MTVTVTICNRDANEIMDIVKKLRAEGCQQGQDFDFAYYQGHWNEMTGDVPKSADFTFYTEKYASLFALRYAS
jgi:hypothetical protein